MKTMAQLRLDPETRRVLDGLAKRKGWTTSEILRKGIHLVAREAEEEPRFRIIGLGEFDSGVPDLGSNKKHMEGYGKKRRPASVVVRKSSGQ